MHRIAHLALAFWATVGCTGALSQTVIRCGNAYGEQACPSGSVVPADDPRTQAQRAQASAVIARDARMAQAMEAARLKAESEARPRPVPVRDQTAGRAAPQEHQTKKLRTPPHFTAVAPGPTADQQGTRKTAARKDKAKKGAQAARRAPVTKARSGSASAKG
jgi:hypothetical protein